MTCNLIDAIPFIGFVIGFLAAGCALIVAIGRAAHAGDEAMRKALEDK